MTEVIFLDPALAEMREAARWYDKKEPVSALSFCERSITRSINSCLIRQPGPPPVKTSTAGLWIVSRSTCCIESAEPKLKLWQSPTTAESLAIGNNDWQADRDKSGVVLLNRRTSNAVEMVLIYEVAL